MTPARVAAAQRRHQEGAEARLFGPVVTGFVVCVGFWLVVLAGYWLWIQ